MAAAPAPVHGKRTARACLGGAVGRPGRWSPWYEDEVWVPAARAAKIAAVLPLVALAACAGGSERALRVTVDLRGSADAVCIVAREQGPPARVVLAMPYEASTLPMPATLTFVAGPGFSGAVEVSAHGVQAGAIVGGSSIVTTLAGMGTSEVTLPVERCRARDTAGFGTRPGGTFAALLDPPRLLAADYDADGRDELLAIAADGSLAVLDAENASDGSHRESELNATDARLVSAVDHDADCRSDVIAVGGLGALVVASEDGRSLPPLASGARDVAIGRVGGTAPLRLVVAGAGGLGLVPPPGATGSSTPLSSTALDHVVAWDADGDGGSELVATGATGLVAFQTALGAETEVTATFLPAGFSAFTGPLAIGDADDDGDVDLVIAEGDTLHVATRRGASFRDDSGATPVALDASVSRLALVDVSGDCADDVVALSSNGTLVVHRVAATGGLVRIDQRSGALDFAVGDFDGDGIREIAFLGTGGRVTLWQP